MKTIIKQISFWGAVLASLLLALNIPISGWAYVLFIASNMATLTLIKDTNTPRVIFYQILFFTVINLIGIGRWLL